MGWRQDITMPAADNQGFILVAVMVIMLLLVVIGRSAITTSTIEVQIAGNDKFSKKAFYAADGGVEMGSRVLEENVACPAGFTADPSDAAGRALVGKIAVPSTALDFWKNTAAAEPSDSSRDLYYPKDYTGNQVHTNVTVGGQTGFLQGSALQMVAGYEGKGKGAAAGGGYIRYDIISQRFDAANSKSEVQIVWRHVIGLEGECNY